MPTPTHTILGSSNTSPLMSAESLRIGINLKTMSNNYNCGTNNDFVTLKLGLASFKDHILPICSLINK